MPDRDATAPEVEALNAAAQAIRVRYGHIPMPAAECAEVAVTAYLDEVRADSARGEDHEPKLVPRTFDSKAEWREYAIWLEGQWAEARASLERAEERIASLMLEEPSKTQGLYAAIDEAVARAEKAEADLAVCRADKRLKFGWK